MFAVAATVEFLDNNRRKQRLGPRSEKICLKCFERWAAQANTSDRIRVT